MPPTRLIDITRLVSRAGLNTTGVDRVEEAYLSHFLSDPRPVFGLVRTALGYLLLGPDGLKQFHGCLTKGGWGPVDFLSRFSRKLSPAAKLGQSCVRRLAVSRCRHKYLTRMLTRQFQDGFVYYNVGHSNLSQQTLSQVKTADGRISVLIHDTIPIDYAHTQTTGSVSAFKTKLRITEVYADRVLCSTQAVAADVMRHAPGVASVCIARFGAALPALSGPAPVDLPTRPFVVCVGTIEPRKNHALLLDIWKAWPDAPLLVIIGRRGWNNDAVFARLDEHPENVLELNNVTDDELSHWVYNAKASLLPSLAEGFGLPPVESLALGTPVLVTDLPVFKEVLGEYATFIDLASPNIWKIEVERVLGGQGDQRYLGFQPPDWSEHFDLIVRDEW